MSASEIEDQFKTLHVMKWIIGLIDAHATEPGGRES